MTPVQVQMTDLAHDGAGVGRHDGLVLFVPGAVPGDTVLVDIDRRERRWARGRIRSIVTPSPARAEPLCPVADRCGGCQLQHISYPDQVRFKQKRLAGELAKTVGFAGDVRFISAAVPWQYRNRAQYPVQMGPDGLVAGFFERGSHEIVPTDFCPLQHPLVTEAVAAAVDIARELEWPAYDESTQRGELRHIAVRTAVPAGPVLVTLVMRTGRVRTPDLFAERLQKRVPRVSTVAVNINPDVTNVIFGRETRLLSGSGIITQSIGGISFRLDATSFFQVFPAQAERLSRLAVGSAGARPGVSIIDVYAGSGLIGLTAARDGASVTAIESVPAAVELGRQTAGDHGLAVRYVEGDAGSRLDELVDCGATADAVIVDPPRRGCDERVLAAIERLGAERIVYVSCNPATLCRDIKRLGSYELAAVTGVDMFPHTAHIEAVALLLRRGVR